MNQTDSADLGQMDIHSNYSNRPNPSNFFTGQREVIAKLKRHFSNTNESAQKRMFFLLYGIGGIGKTQICLKFIQEMSDW
jgi:Holliday junction resolvasome RuvABC ATP-dependent DNA helicase subunit